MDTIVFKGTTWVVQGITHNDKFYATKWNDNFVEIAFPEKKDKIQFYTFFNGIDLESLRAKGFRISFGRID